MKMLYGYQVKESFFNTVKNTVKNTVENSFGYQVQVRKDSKVVYGRKPDWLDTSSTVFYYDQSSKDEAEILARKLTNLTGLQFKEKRGPENSPYVERGKERWTFFIHVVGSRA